MNFMDMNFPPMSDNGEDDKILAMAFVNMQPLEAIYDTDRGFENGTLFPALNKPWEVGGAGR